MARHERRLTFCPTTGLSQGAATLRFDGKTVLITGAGGAIGGALASGFAREGASVVVVDVSAEAARAVVEQIVDGGGSAAFCQTDLRDLGAIDAMIGFACERFGGLDVLVNNAVAVSFGRVGDLDIESWESTLRVSLTSYWYAIKASLGVMIRQGSGVVLNTASVSGLAGDYGLAAYNVAKAGVINLTRSTALDYGREGIRCNAICPGPIGTPNMLAAEQARPDVLGPVKEVIPMGRFGRPDEVASVALFLASEEASFITGACFVVDGGLNAHTNLPSFGNADW